MPGTRGAECGARGPAGSGRLRRGGGAGGGRRLGPALRGLAGAWGPSGLAETWGRRGPGRELEARRGAGARPGPPRRRGSNRGRGAGVPVGTGGGPGPRGGRGVVTPRPLDARVAGPSAPRCGPEGRAWGWLWQQSLRSQLDRDQLLSRA